MTTEKILPASKKNTVCKLTLEIPRDDEKNEKIPFSAINEYGGVISEATFRLDRIGEGEYLAKHCVIMG